MERPMKTIKLSRVYALHGTALSELRLKEPTLDDYVELGEPVEVQTGPGGERIVVENLPALKAYLERCIDGIDPANLGLLGLADARALREALHGFFRREASPKPPASASSSISAGASPSSAG
jgi:hypothetical protein